MTKNGLVYALSAYLIWGLFPLYWKQLAHISSMEILAHRTLWAALLMVIVISIQKQWPAITHRLKQPKLLALSLLATLLVGWNWGLYIYAVNTGHIVETSMGYYINPLINVILGTIFFKERLRLIQWLAISIAAAGVAYLIIDQSYIPYIALTLAGSFACYGVVKKNIKMPASQSMTIETGLLFLPALVWLLFNGYNGQSHFGETRVIDTLLVVGGAVTVIPLMLFSTAAQRMSFSLLGICQYLAPSLQLIIAIIIYKEPFSGSTLIAFICIWLALALFTSESLLYNRRKKLI